MPSVSSSLCVGKPRLLQWHLHLRKLPLDFSKKSDNTFQIWLKPDKNNKAREEIRTFMPVYVMKAIMVTLVINVTKLPMVTIITPAFLVCQSCSCFYSHNPYQITNVIFGCRGDANALDEPTFPLSYITVCADLSLLMCYLAPRIV